MYFGYTFTFPKDDTTIFPTLVTQQYERNEIEVAIPLIEAAKVFIDIGANIGVYSVIGANSMKGEGRTFCFEPSPDNANILRGNITKNNCKNVSVEEVLVGDVNKKAVKFYLTGNDCGMNSVRYVTNNSILREQVALDSFLQERKVTLSNADFIKIDVEGYEPEVFYGMQKTLQNTPTVLFEFSRENYIEPRVKINGNDVLTYLEKCYGGFYIVNANSLSKLQKIDKTELLKTDFADVLLRKV
jgi:FkbM family methyltransferase